MKISLFPNSNQTSIRFTATELAHLTPRYRVDETIHVKVEGDTRSKIIFKVISDAEYRAQASKKIDDTFSGVYKAQVQNGNPLNRKLTISLSKFNLAFVENTGQEIHPDKDSGGLLTLYPRHVFDRASAHLRPVILDPPKKFRDFHVAPALPKPDMSAFSVVEQIQREMEEEAKVESKGDLLTWPTVKLDPTPEVEVRQPEIVREPVVETPKTQQIQAPKPVIAAPTENVTSDSLARFKVNVASLNEMLAQTPSLYVVQREDGTIALEQEIEEYEEF